MEFAFQGKFWLKDGFRFPSLSSYIHDTRQALSQPLKVPAYATAGEEQRIRELSRKTEKNPYLNRTAINEAIRQMNHSYKELRSIPYGERPVLYEVCMFATKLLMDADPMIFLYTTDQPGMVYNACAVDHREKVWIYVSSQFFREHGMLSDRELCFLLGHELGHAQCHHSTLSTLVQDTSDDEYSADRAGMIVCAQWILRRNPEYTVEQAVEEALRCGAAVLMKLTTGVTNGKDNTDWSAFPYEAVREAVEQAAEKAARKPLSDGSHPTDEHRIMAMVHFSESQLLYRCLGLDPRQYRDLINDAQLNRAMASQRTFREG